MATTPIGPAWMGQFVEVILNDPENPHDNYTILFLPDKNNPILAKEKEPLHFYYMLNSPRLSTHPNGDYIFSLTEFSAILDSTQVIGVNKDTPLELAGGQLTFSFTMDIPEEILAKVKEQLKQNLSSSNNPYYRWSNDNPEIKIGPIPIAKSKVSLLPVGRDEEAIKEDGTIGYMSFDVDGIDGIISPGDHALSGLLGAGAVQLVKSAMQGKQSNLHIINELQLKVFSMASKIEITGDWTKIHQHFSKSIKGKILFAAGEIQNEIDELISKGYLNVKITYDAQFVGSDEAEKLNAVADARAEKFIDMAQKTIFDKVPAKTDPAKAADPAKQGGFFDGFIGIFYGKWHAGATFALKKKKDINTLELNYSKTVTAQRLITSKLSGALVGLHDVLNQDEENYNKYFRKVFLEEGFQKLFIVARSNVNWEQDPVNSVSIEVSYKDSKGNPVNKNAARSKPDLSSAEIGRDFDPAIWEKKNKDQVFFFEFTKHDDEEIEVKTRVSFENQNNVFVNEITDKYQTNNHTLEVSVPASGKLEIGPMELDQVLSDNTTVYIELEIPKNNTEKIKRKIRFTSKEDYKEEILTFWYEDLKRFSGWRYKAKVTVKGNAKNKTLKYEGDWIKEESSGPVMFSLPDPPKE